MKTLKQCNLRSQSHLALKSGLDLCKGQPDSQASVLSHKATVEWDLWYLCVLGAVELAPTLRGPTEGLCPVLNNPAHLIPVTSSMESIHLVFGLSLFPADFYFSQHNCLFQRTTPSQNMPEVGQLQICYF